MATPTEDITIHEVLTQIKHLNQKIEDYIDATRRSHEDIWRRLDGINNVLHGHDGLPGIQTEVALLKAYRETMQEKERIKGYREWGIFILLLGLLLKVIFFAG